MRRILKALSGLLALLLCGTAVAQELPEAVEYMLPEGAVVQHVHSVGNLQLITASIPQSGEELVLSYDGVSNALLLVETSKAASYNPEAVAMGREDAEALIRADYPECRVIFSENTDEGKRLGVMSDVFCGTVTVADGHIIFRSLRMGQLCRDGKLTMEGALQVLKLHRPEAEFRALELDEEDGTYIYEGEALLDGVEYEFELNVSTGRLLEWERDD